MKIFTIGHGNHPFSKFTQLLESNGIKRVVDVRTTPYSKYNLQFGREAVEHSLSPIDIHYTYLGKDLGGRPTDPSCYKNRKLPEGKDEVDFLHEVDYPEVMKREWFLRGIAGLLALAKKQPTAIMCSEEDPAHCHRHHLIAKYLLSSFSDIEILHIRGDGHVFNAKDLHASVDQPDNIQSALFEI